MIAPCYQCAQVFDTRDERDSHVNASHREIRRRYGHVMARHASGKSFTSFSKTATPRQIRRLQQILAQEAIPPDTC